MNPADARAEKRRPRVASSGWAPRSLARKLPMLLTAVLAVVLASSLVLTYGTLALSAESGARDRLQRAVREIAGTMTAQMRERALLLRAAARTPEIVRAVSARDLRGAQDVLAPLVARDSLALELWDQRGERVLLVGGDREAPWRAPRSRAAMAASAERDVSDTVGRPNRVSFTPMFAVADRVYFWGIAPVFDGARVIGYLAQERRVTGPAGATRALRELTGEDVSMFVRNRDGSSWVSAPGTPAAAATNRDSSAFGVTHHRPGVGEVIAAEWGVDATPWLAVLETPLRSVKARARATAATLAALGLLLVTIGAVLTLGISRRVTRPLVALTRAAEDIAEGNYNRRVSIGKRRDDEIGRLADSFEQMADEIAASREELERRVEDAQASADALERANLQLTDAIRDADLARHDAERASRAKSDFLAVMSHELRTPLNAIAGYAQLLELEVFGPVNEAQRDALARIARSEAHLLGLINSVLDFAKIDAGQAQFTLSDVSLDGVLSAVEPLVAPQMRAKGLAFEYRPCDPGLVVRADAEKLQQIVINLLTNAIKFTPSGGRVTLDCDADARVARVHVRDTGVGIPPDRLHDVFEPFVQGDRALNRPNEGVGLGLAIARDLARGMDGSLRVESRPGEGSVFTVAVPLASTYAEPRGTTTAKHAQTT